MEKSLVYLVVIIFIGLVAPGLTKGVIKGGIYKIQSVTDNSVLTVTYTGHPKQVITDDWEEKGVQEWRVRSTENNGQIRHIIRNEFVKSNEVNKEELPGTEGKGKNGKTELVIVEWIFIPVVKAAQEKTFVLDKGTGCLTNNGKGQRISYERCDASVVAQQWHFEWLFEKEAD